MLGNPLNEVTLLVRNLKGKRQAVGIYMCGLYPTAEGRFNPFLRGTLHWVRLGDRFKRTRYRSVMSVHAVNKEHRFNIIGPPYHLLHEDSLFEFILIRSVVNLLPGACSRAIAGAEAVL